jgi:hypothetical protein
MEGEREKANSYWRIIPILFSRGELSANIKYYPPKVDLRPSAYGQ